MSALFRPCLHWWRARLSQQIIVPAVLLTLLFLAALGFVAFRMGQRAIVDQIETRNQQVAAQVGQEITTFFQNVLDTLRLQEQALLATDDRTAHEQALISLRAKFPYTYGDLRLLNDQGEQLLLMSGPLHQILAEGVSHFDPPESVTLGADVTAALETRSIRVSPVAFRPITSSPYVTMTLPLSDENTYRMLVVQIDLRSFWTRVDSLQVAGGGISIVDQQGTILAHPDRQRIGQQLDIEAIALMFAGYANSTTYTQDGITYLAAYSPLRGVLRGWGVLVEQQRSTALAPVRTIAFVAILVTLLSGVSVALLLSNVVRSAVQPVELLSQAASDIAVSGNLGEHPRCLQIVGFEPTHEIAILTDSFNRMIAGLYTAHERLVQWNEALEQRVIERTAQLHTVMDVARLSGGSLQEQEVLSTILAHIGRLVEYDTATILLLNPTGTLLETVAMAGMVSVTRRSTHPLSYFPLNEAVINTRSAIIVPDTSRDPRWRSTDTTPLIAGSWLGVPLLVKEQPIGLLAVLKTQINFYGAEEVQLLTALASQVAITIAHARLYEDSVHRIERELALAEEIQRHLFPTAAPQIEGLLAAAFYKPARETTGDFYEFIPIIEQGMNGRLGIIVGDVSGKSLPAALLMAMARTALSAAARTTPTDPATVLGLANTVLMGDMPRGSFVASSYAAFDPTDRTLALVNAAQPAPMLLRDGMVLFLEGTGSHLPLGVVPSPIYEALRLDVYPGDVFVFYTDGVIEAHNKQRELFGFERLEAVIAGCADLDLLPQQIIERIIAAVSAWSAGMPQHDDIALMVLRVTQV